MREKTTDHSSPMADHGSSITRHAPRAAVSLVLAFVAQSEAYAGRGGNALVLFFVAAVLYLWSRPRVGVETGRTEASASTRPASVGADASVRPLVRPIRLVHPIVASAYSLALALATLAYVLFGRAYGGLLPWLPYLLALAVLLGLGVWMRRGDSLTSLTPLPEMRKGGGGRSAVRPYSPPRFGEGRGERFVLVAILARAAFMRLYRLDVFPAGVYFDEATNAMEAVRAAGQGHFPPFFPGDLGYYGRFGALYEYILAFMLSMGGANELALRLSAVFPGVLAVALFYRLSRELFPTPVALAAAFFLAGSRWHANFSRIAFDAVMVPTLLIAAMLFLLQALRRGDGVQSVGHRAQGTGDDLPDSSPVPCTPSPDPYASGYILSGLCLGLGLMTYTAFRLAPLLAVGTVVLYALFRRLTWREAALGLTMLILATVVAATPEVFHARKDPKTFWERAKTVSVLRGRSPWAAREDIARNVRLHLAMFNFAGDRNGRHNLPGWPMLDQPAAALFVLGVAACLAARRRPEAWLLLVWLLLMLAGGVASLEFEAPQSLRAIGALPVAYLIAALPLADLWQRWRTTCGGWLRGPLAVLVGAGVLWYGSASFGTFFVRQAGDYAVWNAFSTAETRVGRELRRLGRGWRVELDPLFVKQPTIRFLAPEFLEPEPFNPVELLPLRQSGASGTAIFVSEQTHSLVRLMARWYPEATLITHANPADKHTTLYEYLLTPEQVRAVQGLELTASWTGAPATGVSPQLRWQPTVGQESPRSLSWRGVLLAPDSGTYRLRLQAPGEALLMLDGALAASAPGRPRVTLELDRGRHDLWAEAVPAGEGEVGLYWQPPGEAAESPVPRESLYHAPIEAGGLRGDYIPGGGDDWAAEPAFSRIDPELDFYFHLTPLPRPYRVRWQGWLLPPLPGSYELRLRARDRAELWLDDNLVVAVREPGETAAGIAQLDGPVPIEVRFWDETGYTGILLCWRRPDGVEEVVPYTALQPPAATVATDSLAGAPLRRFGAD